MNLRRGLILGALVLVAAVLWYLHQPAPIETRPASPSTPTARLESSPAPSLEAPAGPTQTPSSPEPGTPGAPAHVMAAVPRPGVGAPPQPSTVLEADSLRSDLDRVRSMVRDYRSIVGENPVGTNAEIMKALMGGNKKGAQLGPPEGQKLNSQGELVDRWGTPYFFHQLSRTDMEIRSAGPDRVMWTDDDQVTK